MQLQQSKALTPSHAEDRADKMKSNSTTRLPELELKL